MKYINYNVKLSRVICILSLFVANESKSQFNKYFKTFVHFKIEDTSAIWLPDYDSSFTGTYPLLQTLIDSSLCKRIYRPYRVIDTTQFGRIYLMEFTDTLKLDYLIHQLNVLPWIHFAEKVPRYTVQSFTLEPKDTMAWHFDQVRLADAFNFAGSPGNSVKIAVIDNAFRTNHEDLTNAVYTNPLETVNGIDDDSNGYIDDISGWDCADNDNNAGLPNGYKGEYANHGTMAGGIPCAQPNNSKGITGSSFGSKLIPIKLLSDRLVNNSAAMTIIGDAPATLGMTYAVKIKADVVNMSFAGYYSTPPIVDSLIIEWGYNNGIIWVTAAGNNDNDYNGKIYPNSFAHVISVGATNLFGEKTFYSNYGNKTKIDVFAPGHGLPVPDSKSTNAYSFASGTSAAAPFAAGIIALAKSQDSTLTFADIRNSLKLSSQNNDFLDPKHKGGFGPGLIDAYAFIKKERTKNILWNTQRGKRTFCAADTIKLRLSKTFGCLWKLRIKDISDVTILDTIVTDTLLKFRISSPGRYHILFDCLDSAYHSIVYHSKKFPYAISISECTNEVPYRGFSLWQFGNKAAIQFTSKGPRAAFNNDIHFAGNPLSLCDYGGNYRWFGGLNNDSSKLKLIGHDFNKNSNIYKNHSHKVDRAFPGFPGTFRYYQAMMALVARHDTTSISIVQHSNPQDYDEDEPEAFILSLIGKNTNTYNEVKLNYNGYYVKYGGSSAMQNGLQIARNPNGSGWYLFFMGERAAYPAQKQIYAAHIPDTFSSSAFTVTDSINIGILAFRTDENKIVLSPQCDKLFFFGNGMVEWAASPTVKYRNVLMGFNPVTGKFSGIIDSANISVASASFSFSGKYLYTFELDDRSDYYLYQNILTDTSIIDKKLVTHLESKNASGMQLGPDKSIYINPGDVDYLCAIKYPENQNVSHLSNECGFYRKEVNINYNDTTEAYRTNRNTGFGLPIYCFDPIEELNDTINFTIACDSIRFFNNGAKLQKWYFQGDSAYGNKVSFKIKSLLYRNANVAKTFRGEWMKKQIALPMPTANWEVHNCSTMVVNTTTTCSSYYSVVYMDSIAIDSMKTTYSTSPGLMPSMLSVRFLDSFFNFTVDFPDSAYRGYNLKMYPGRPAEISINTNHPFPYIGLIAFRNGVFDSVNFKYNRTVGLFDYYRFSKPGVYILHRLTDCGSMPFDTTIVRYGCDSSNFYDSLLTGPILTLPPFGLTLKNKSYLVRGNWDVVNAGVKIDNALVVFDTCSYFKAGEGANISITNAEMTGCKSWSGIVLNDGSNSLNMAGSIVSFAQAAIQNYKGSVNVTHSYFGANARDLISYDTASRNHLTHDSFTNNYCDSGDTCELLQDSLQFARNIEGHIIGKNLKIVYVRNNEFISHTPASSRMFTLYADNCDSLDFSINSNVGNADTGIFVVNCTRPWIRAGKSSYMNTFNRFATNMPENSSKGIVFARSKSVKHYDYIHHDWRTAVEFNYTGARHHQGSIRNNIFSHCYYGIVSASKTNPMEAGSSSINSPADSVQLRVFCNEFNYSHVAFVGLGRFPMFTTNFAVTNAIAFNIFNNCDNAFFAISNDSIIYNYDPINMNEQPKYLNQINGNIFLNDVHYNNLILSNIKAIPWPNGLQYCGSNPSIQPLFRKNTTQDRLHGLKVYPNPTYGKIMILSEYDIKMVTVYSTGGTKLLEYHNLPSVDISQFESGVYIIRVSFSSGSSTTLKIVKI